MAVTSYVDKSGATLWKVSSYARSSSDPSIRVQKTKFAIESEKEAFREEARLRRECEREAILKETQGSSWAAVLDVWAKSLDKENLGEAVRTDYIAAAYNHTTQWFRRPASSITAVDVKELVELLKAQGRTYEFIKRMKNLLNRIFIFGMQQRLIKGIDRSPTFGVQVGRPEEKKPEILTIAEIRKLLTCAKEMKSPWYHHWALALLTGMRSGELYALLFTDVDWESNVITVSKSYDSRFNRTKSTKGGYWRAVPISQELRTLLLELKAQAGDRPQVLPRLRDWQMGMQAQELRKFCAGIGIPSVRFHTLRACFSTQLIRNGVPPIQIQKICGWRDLKTMQRYIRMAGIEIEGATEALKVLPDPQIAEKVTSLFAPASV